MNISNMKRIFAFGKKHWRGLAVSIIAIVFFALVSSLINASQKDMVKWSSPDETANYVFSKLYGQTGRMSFFEKYNLYAEDLMHPRSMRSDHGVIKPVSFPGVILIYGKISSVVGHKLIPYLTPFFGALGIIFFYLLIKRIFGKTSALLSALLLAGFPVWIYYSARSMFHNVLFVSLFIIGMYFLLLMGSRGFKAPFMSRKADWKGMAFAALAGLFMGGTLITRTSELLWVAPLLFLLWLFNIRRVGLSKLLIFLSFLFLSLLPALFWNQVLYGSPFFGGYAEMNSSITSIKQSGSDLVKATVSFEPEYIKYLLATIKENIFYFGLHPGQSLDMFYHYFIKMFSWLFFPACLGLILYLQRIYKWKRSVWLFFLSYALISSILILYYGSWEFHDNPDTSSFTIGNSYTRYWLPVYLGSFPLVAFFLMRFSHGLLPEEGGFVQKKKGLLSKILRRPRKKVLTLGVRAFFLGLIFIASVNFVMIGSEEGLLYGFPRKRNASVQLKRVLKMTESDSVIITRYHDKLFFPQRKVIVGSLTDNNMNRIYKRLSFYLPVYYYSFTFPPRDIKYLNERKLKEAGLRIEKAGRVSEDFTLYRLLRRQSPEQGLKSGLRSWREGDLLKYMSSNFSR